MENKLNKCSLDGCIVDHDRVYDLCANAKTPNMQSLHALTEVKRRLCLGQEAEFKHVKTPVIRKLMLCRMKNHGIQS